MLSGIFNKLPAMQTDTTATDTLAAEDAAMRKSPIKALALSFVLPGMGQIYTEEYWKTPLFVGATGGLVYAIVFNHNNYIDYRDQVDELLADEETDPSSYEVEVLKSKREFFRDNRDLSGLYLLGVYALAAVDAYVGAHLYDFDVSDDLSLRLLPDVRSGVRLSLSYRIR